jgi:hypothetical protein
MDNSFDPLRVRKSSTEKGADPALGPTMVIIDASATNVMTDWENAPCYHIFPNGLSGFK